MLNILIVDDSLSNQLVIESLLDQYSDDFGVKFNIDTAMHGQDAIDHCDILSYDIILMDIMMPVMSGIDATEMIHKAYPKTMIIAVSAVDDAEHETKMLQSGAEDYIHKPINPDLFLSRLSNYLSLINFRKNKPYLPLLPKAHNCINKNIYSRKTNFKIDTEDNLAEFWEYYLLDHDEGKELTDLIRTFHEIGTLALTKKLHPDIWIEYTNDSTYFTMTGLENISEHRLRQLLAVHIKTLHYHIVEGTFTAVIPNLYFTAYADATKQESIIAPTNDQEAYESTENPMTDLLKIESSNEKIIFDFMVPEDLLDMREYLAKLNSLLIIVSKGDIEIEEVEEIASYLKRMGKISAMYSESYSIGMALSNFSREIANHIGVFQEKSSALGELCIAFGQDIDVWIRLIFEEGAPSVNCMDESIIFNSLMLCEMLNDSHSTVSNVTIDDIFDF